MLGPTYWPAFAVTPWQTVHQFTFEALRNEAFQSKTESQKPFQESITLRITLERNLHEYAKAGGDGNVSLMGLSRQPFTMKSKPREYSITRLIGSCTADAYLIEQKQDNEVEPVRQVYYQLVYIQVIENNRNLNIRPFQCARQYTHKTSKCRGIGLRTSCAAREPSQHVGELSDFADSAADSRARRDVWEVADRPGYVECWLEKDLLSRDFRGHPFPVQDRPQRRARI